MAFTGAARVVPDLTQDAVVIVPGIMGSALRDDNGLLWGLSPRWLLTAWGSDGTTRALRLDDEERAGRYGRVKPAGLLKTPAYAVGLGGFEPYTDLCKAVGEVVADEAAVCEFAYDWRLPVEYNARLLAGIARRHLAAWRRHPRHDQVRRVRPDQREARLVFVAHSMGGLLVRALGLPEVDGELADEIRAVITIGTPFRGAAKAVLLLNTGEGAPLPRRRLRDLVRVLPGVHDLLPTYRCLDLGGDVVHLDPASIAALGGDEELAKASADFHARLARVAIPGHRQYVGLDQPTVSSLVVEHGVAYGRFHTFEVNSDDNSLVRHPGTGVLKRVERRGDGTVPRNSAELIDGDASPPQQHGALARSPEVLRGVRRVLLGGPSLGGVLGDGGPGLDVPDLVAVGRPWPITVVGTHNPTCTIYDVDHPHRPVATVPLGRRPLPRTDGAVTDATYPGDPHHGDARTGEGPPLPPGLYHVEVQDGAYSPVRQITMIYQE